MIVGPYVCHHATSPGTGLCVGAAAASARKCFVFIRLARSAVRALHELAAGALQAARAVGTSAQSCTMT